MRRDADEKGYKVVSASDLMMGGSGVPAQEIAVGEMREGTGGEQSLGETLGQQATPRELQRYDNLDTRVNALGSQGQLSVGLRPVFNLMAFEILGEKSVYLNGSTTIRTTVYDAVLNDRITSVT